MVALIPTVYVDGLSCDCGQLPSLSVADMVYTSTLLLVRAVTVEADVVETATCIVAAIFIEVLPNGLNYVMWIATKLRN